jgi:uncharacterized protein YutE (UPF0331/DUF86 family)
MYDISRIESIISDIFTYINKLESFKIKSVKDLEDDKNFYSSSMIIFNSINRTIDLAEQVVSDRSLGTATEYKELFELLEYKKIISQATSRKIQDLIRLRNKISHRYGNITKEDIFNSILMINSLKEFIKDIEKEVKRK